MKKEIILLLAVIVALSSYVFMRDTDRTHYELPVLSAIAPKEVDRMEVKHGNDTLLFEKQGEVWTVDIERFPAKQDEVAKMIQAAGGLSLTALVSESESYSRYDLNPEAAQTVTLFNGDTKLRSLSIGKAAPSQGHTFVTVGDDKNVYHALGNLSGQFSTDPTRFIDKGVLSLNPAEVKTIAVTFNGASRTFARATEAAPEGGEAKTVWKDDAGTTFDAAAVEGVIAPLTRLSCDTWLVEKPEATTPMLSLTLTTDGPHTLTFFGESPMKGSSSDKPLAFSLTATTDAAIRTAVDTLMGAPAGTPPASDAP